MKFDCHTDGDRFWFLLPGLQKYGLLNSLSGQSFRKTLCLYGEKINIFVRELKRLNKVKLKEVL